ncbi:sm-like protein LSM5 isoform X2 [Carex rostrata]
MKVWVLDATPGKVRAGGDGEDHPGELISFLRNMPDQMSAMECLLDQGEITAKGRQITKLDQILLNGNNIAILVPGGSPEE